MLCQAGAAADGLDDDGAPLATAVSFGQDQAAQVLADFARVDNPLFAAAVGRLDLLREMIDEKGQLCAGVAHCRVPWLRMSRDPVVVVRQALAAAVRFGRLETVRWLVEVGVDPLRPTKDGGTPFLHQAAAGGHVDVVRYLLAQGADPDARDEEHGGTALDWARNANHADVVKLLESGSND